MDEIIYRPMETAALLEGLRDHLRKRTHEYVEAENERQKAVQRLKTALNPDTFSLLDTYINAEETRISACLQFLFWQGVNLNSACFRDPVQKKFLDLDFEDICQETVLNSMPEAFRCDVTFRTLHEALTKSEARLMDSITDYYCYLETVGYKLAHYWGFQYGDALLPTEIPGYVSDLAVTAAYRRMVWDYLEFDPDR